ncbi:MAG: VOC family protein [Actinobacteria bacterium]|nr:VOC family protein [Actinomycetota bacterium]
MTEGTRDRGGDAALVELVVADPPEAWAGAGFTVAGDAVLVGATRIRLAGPRDAHGITGWSLAGIDGGGLVDGHLDGLPTQLADHPGPAHPSGHVVHPNGVTGLDHVVVVTPDLDRTIAALAGVGLACRRIRETESYGSPMRQAFFRLGPTVLEVVSGDTGTGLPAADAPAGWFGLAVDVDDLDRTAELLGEGFGTIRDAVQDGRRIATFRHEVLGLSVAVAAMDDRARPGR